MPGKISGPQIYPKLKDAPTHKVFVDAYTTGVRELVFLRNPGMEKTGANTEEQADKFLAGNQVAERYIYYPWLDTLVRSVAEEEYFELRTARNRNIITKEEQESYRKLKVGIAGLSVGSSIVNALVMSGGPKALRLADFDSIEPTNLNRMQAGLADVGTKKTDVAAKRVWEIDPDAELEVWHEGVSAKEVEKFVAGPWALDVFVDEMDSLDAKVAARQVCRRLKVPVVMATDNGDGVILDVERFDQEDDRPLFHGLIDEAEVGDLSNLDYASWLALSTKIVGPEFLTERMQDSLIAIGKQITGVPQLGTAASLAGAAVSFALRRIASGLALDSGRYVLGLEQVLVPKYNSAEQAEERNKKTNEFKKLFSK